MAKVPLNLPPQQILNDPFLNKGSAFTDAERTELKLHGLLPYHVSTIEQQIKRRYQNFCARPDNLSRYVFLTALQNRNEILFYRLVMEHLDEMLPLIYTPTVGEVSQQYSTLYSEGRGLYLSYPLRDKIPEIIARLPKDRIAIVVVTDGQRILGLGDLGVGGMAIPVGKLSLYTLFGGVHPLATLPVMLDVGTDNPELLNDPLYLGWRHPRISGKEYDEFVDLFVQALKQRYPNVLLQWEDFGRAHAHPLLARYRDTICSFNDDIQGTAATVLAALFAATRHTNQKLKDQKILLFGAGSAGMGICNKLVQAMCEEGLSRKEAQNNFYLVDRFGLVHSELQEVTAEQKAFARPFDELRRWRVKDPKRISLLEVVQNAKPHILIGVSTQAGAFTEEIVTAMAKEHAQPIILPLSNPTSHSEAHPQDLLHWTDGKALIATGSPFGQVLFNGKSVAIAQCNNVFIFPGVGLGVIISGAKKVTDQMFLRAARILSEHAPKNALFPSFDKLREISEAIALGVAEVAGEEGASSKLTKAELKKRLKATVWYPEYPNYCKST